VLNVLDLVLGDDAANDRMLPVVVRANQSPGAIVQFQCRISQGIRNAILAELRANRTYNDALWLSPFYNEPANHQVVARLHKGASAEISQIGSCGSYQVVTNDIEVDPFRRCRGDIGKLIAANECILHKRMALRARL